MGSALLVSESALQQITAYGTAGGAVATFLAVLVALWQARRAREQAQEAHSLALAALALSRADREDAEARQARQVTSRVTNGTPAGVVHVHNTSAEPIGAVRVEAVYLDTLVAPAEWTYSLAPGHSAPMVEGGSSFMVLVEFRDADGELVELPQTRGATADLSFVDSRGVRWRRWGLVQPRPADNAAVHRDPPFVPTTHTYGGPGSAQDRA